MFKFEKDGYVKYFETAEETAEWLIQQADECSELDILYDVEESFDWWLNENFTAYDILMDAGEDPSLHHKLRKRWKQRIINLVADADYFEEVTEVQD